MSSVRHHSQSSSRLLAMLATTTWVCSCGSGVASALTARAQACSITTASKPCVSCRNAPWAPTRTRTASDSSSRSAASTAARCAASSSRRVSVSPKVSARLMLLGALKAKSQPPTRFCSTWRSTTSPLAGSNTRRVTNAPLVGRRRRSPLERVAALDEADDRARRGVALEAEQLGAAAPPEARPLAPLGVVVVQAVPERLLVVGGARQVHRRHAQHDDAPPAGMPRRSPFPAAPRLRSCLTRRRSRPRRDARRTRGPSRRPVMSGGYRASHHRCIRVGVDR